ncbi:hypothetical protein [Gracilibacillus thailandensis]|nr:hypothetical protein [Gracilibacillus thailandensis]
MTDKYLKVTDKRKKVTDNIPKVTDKMNGGITQKFRSSFLDDRNSLGFID